MKKLYSTTAVILLAVSTNVLANNEGKDDHSNNSNNVRPDNQIQGQIQGQALFNKTDVRTSIKTNSANNNANSTTANPVVNTSGGMVNGSISSNPSLLASGNGTGGYSQASADNSRNVLQSNYQQVKQAPMAWSPNMAMSMSPETVQTLYHSGQVRCFHFCINDRGTTTFTQIFIINYYL